MSQTVIRIYQLAKRPPQLSPPLPSPPQALCPAPPTLADTMLPGSGEGFFPLSLRMRSRMGEQSNT